jgi:hypothetical protein
MRVQPQIFLWIYLLFLSLGGLEGDTRAISEALDEEPKRLGIISFGCFNKSVCLPPSALPVWVEGKICGSVVFPHTG